ncbi:uncharacterized protein CLUP02_04722 [Colletotrichum lupini]|uniref:Major facilitator superfamily (MFS) profile domain-containing protein n=1 Tax=Colletotrichum lupini TaxID=145971 RepID=A0A9Q8SL61_9PEZI|nr:uncharacterized protein CLUP02_04722 [Colletotrichum lupini]KAI3548382.1 hypothetical protein CSPX01_03178 [Colletotrichum filicis]UQC79243.1 hypothetical protein CLUP02_04722 [Colletotrichum lupini]
MESQQNPSFHDPAAGAVEKATNSPTPTQEVTPVPSSDNAFPPIREAWNRPGPNAFRVASCFWSLLNLGAFDSAYGAILPHLQKAYNVNYITVSLMFLSPLVGYVASGVLNTRIHNAIGQRGLAVLCGGAHVLSAVISILHPPFPVLVASFMLGGLGNGLADAAWNAWVGNLERPNELLGFLHAAYGVGGIFSPLIATAMIARASMPWYTFYYAVLGISLIELIALTSAFWNHTGRRYRDEMASLEGSDGNIVSMRKTLTTLPEARIAWLSALFVLIYIGVEVSVGGWIVEFMLHVRKGSAFASGMCATGYWLGMTVGRIVLPFVTNLIGPKIGVSVYLALAIAAELIFWLVPNFYASAIAVAFQGMFIGPMFPHAISVVTSLLPASLHVMVIGFIAALGGCGASLLPFAVGILAQRFGVVALQPFVLACLCLSLIVWLLIPHKKDKNVQ